MKTRQEYFEEMAKDVRKFGAECFGEHCLSCSIVQKCFAYYFSKVAYHFGYRKASEVIDEFVENIMTEAEPFLSNMSRNLIRMCASKMKKELAAEMRKEV